MIQVAYKGAVYYLENDKKILFSTYKSAAIATPDPVYAWLYRVKRIKESIATDMPDSQGIQ